MKKILFFLVFFHHIGMANPLFDAIKKGDLDQLHRVISQNMTCVNDQDPENGWTGLHYTARHGELLSFISLVAHPRINFFLRDHQGRTARDLAVEFNQTRIICLFDYFSRIKGFTWED